MSKEPTDFHASEKPKASARRRVRPPTPPETIPGGKPKVVLDATEQQK